MKPTIEREFHHNGSRQEVGMTLETIRLEAKRRYGFRECCTSSFSSSFVAMLLVWLFRTLPLFPRKHII